MDLIYSDVDNLIELAHKFNNTVIDKDELFNKISLSSPNIDDCEAVYIFIEICDAYKYNKLSENIYYCLIGIEFFVEPFTQNIISEEIIKKFENQDLNSEILKCFNNFNYEPYICDMLDYIIKTKKWNFILMIINSKYWDNLNNDEDRCDLFLSYFIDDLLFLPDNIICKFLEKYSMVNEYFGYMNWSISNMKIIYYTYYKIHNTKYIPFELFPIDRGNILYTFMILLNEEYIKTKNFELNKFNNIFNKLHYDLQLKICGITNINYKDIRLCSMYLL